MQYSEYSDTHSMNIVLITNHVKQVIFYQRWCFSCLINARATGNIFRVKNSVISLTGVVLTPCTTQNLKWAYKIMDKRFPKLNPELTALIICLINGIQPSNTKTFHFYVTSINQHISSLVPGDPWSDNNWR